jgi:hypothetical protein
MSAHLSHERHTDGYEPQVVHRRIHVGDTVRVTDGAQRGRAGSVTTLYTTSAEVRFDGDGDWTFPKRWLELVGDGAAGASEKSSHARAAFLAVWERAAANGVRIGIDRAVTVVDAFRDTAATNGRDGVTAVLDEIMARLLGRATE